ncbi:YitT family protein [Rhizobiaceae bacterium BDR2-2]|uniref:YitT family protein n=1 Tax=Ectorhizobium quercum TaxID=2965071 RepID=A0AAE3MXQ2_9HYPH|nr:YitT family protein [Ectorhizobium quercum]MCX8995999.1 YitT family protein [Ectorhizobium quercum]
MMLESTPVRHSLAEDAQALVVGAMLSALGVALLKSAGLLSGGTAGVAFLAYYAFEFPFGAAFFAINLPFYYLAWKKVGLSFTVKTFIAVTITSLMAEALPRYIGFGFLDPVVAALFGGVLLGNGMLVFFRHRASLGGFGVLALWLQDRYGIRAGLVQLGLDLIILATSFLVASPRIVFASVLGAVAINLVLAVNHRRDRYIAV